MHWLQEEGRTSLVSWLLSSFVLAAAAFSSVLKIYLFNK